MKIGENHRVMVRQWFDTTSKVWSVRKNSKFEFIKIKQFYSSKDIIKKVNRKPETEKIFTIHIMAKDLYLEFIKTN